MASSALLVGHVGADLFRNTISGLIVLGISFLLGFQPVAGPVEWLLVLALAILFSLAISWLSAIMGLLVKSMEAAQWTGFIVIFPLTFVSSAFVPTDTMPEALRLFAENQPLTHVIEAIRGWLVGSPVGDSGWLGFAWCVGIIIVSVPYLSQSLTPKEPCRNWHGNNDDAYTPCESQPAGITYWGANKPATDCLDDMRKRLVFSKEP